MSHRLDFVIFNGIAKDWRVVLTNETLERHRIKYTYQPYVGPEYFDENFIDNDIEKALNNPKFVFQNIRIAKPPADRKLLEIREGREWVVFYSEFLNEEVKNIIDGACYVENIKIVVIRDFANKVLHIQSFHKTPHIAEKEYIESTKDINDTTYRTINGYHF